MIVAGFIATLNVTDTPVEATAEPASAGVVLTTETALQTFSERIRSADVLDSAELSRELLSCAA